MQLTEQQILRTLTLSETVAKEIMQFYHNDCDIHIKKDNSPVTQADLAASQLLESGLPQIANFPVLSEENTPSNHDWLSWETYWLIDPIDGTKHFINQTGEFCICIALIHKNQSIMGLIYQPTTETAWVAQRGMNVVMKYQNQQLHELNAQPPATTTAALSSCVLTEKMQQLLDSTFSEYHWYQRGSALKYVDIVEGKATSYPKMWDTCEWDSAAGQCLVECSGGKVIRFDNGSPLTYGEKECLLNPHFLSYRNLSKQQVHSLMDAYQKIHQS